MFTSPEGLELIILSVAHTYCTTKHCITVLYRPPSSTCMFLTLFLVYWREKINIAHFFSFDVLGDFNVDFNNCNHPFYPRLTSISQYFVIKQVMTGHTHESPKSL